MIGENVCDPLYDPWPWMRQGVNVLQVGLYIPTFRGRLSSAHSSAMHRILRLPPLRMLAKPEVMSLSVTCGVKSKTVLVFVRSVVLSMAVAARVRPKEVDRVFDPAPELCEASCSERDRITRREVFDSTNDKSRAMATKNT